MAVAHSAGRYATVVFVAGALITGFTVLSTFPAVRVYLSEQFPIALRGRGQYFGESPLTVTALGENVGLSRERPPPRNGPAAGASAGFSGISKYTSDVVNGIIGRCGNRVERAFVPVLFGKETVGQLETVTEGIPELA